MAEKNEYVLRPTNGSSQVVIRGAGRRDALLASGYTLVEEGHPLPPPKAGQSRRKPKTETTEE